MGVPETLLNLLIDSVISVQFFYLYFI